MRRRAWAEARRSTRGGGFSSRGSSHDERRGSSTRGGQVDFAAVPWQGQVMLVGLPSLALIVVLTSGVVVRRRRRKSAQAYAHMLDAFREFDPDFDPSSLSRRIERAFLRCQQAWFLRDMRPVRTLMSDAVYERLRTQLALLHAQGVRDALGEIDVKRVAIRSLEGGTPFDRVVAVVDAHIEDSEAPASASDETARKIARGTRKTWVREFWTFLRRRGASTPAHADPFEGSCPNCGGPVTLAETTNCEHCDVIINSGTYDWTLSAIVQPAFMPEEKPPAPAGLDDARTDDPELSVEMLEDRAALVFWLWISAQTEGEPRRLAKFASPDFLTTLAQAIEERGRAGKRLLFRDCAIGVVRLERVWTEETHQKAALVVEWKAGALERGVDEGVERRSDERPSRRKTTFVLGRRSGTKTRRVEGLSTGRCAFCHAPVGSSLRRECDHCDTDLTTGADWVLLEVDDPVAEG